MDVEENNSEATVEKEDGFDLDKQGSKLTRLPHTRVRHMMKLDPDLHIASQDSVFLITRAAELFIQTYTEMAYKRTLAGKRKTIQRRDLDAVVDEVDCMAFLDGSFQLSDFIFMSREADKLMENGIIGGVLD